VNVFNRTNTPVRDHVENFWFCFHKRLPQQLLLVNRDILMARFNFDQGNRSFGSEVVIYMSARFRLRVREKDYCTGTRISERETCSHSVVKIKLGAAYYHIIGNLFLCARRLVSQQSFPLWFTNWRCYLIGASDNCRKASLAWLPLSLAMRARMMHTHTFYCAIVSEVYLNMIV